MRQKNAAGGIGFDPIPSLERPVLGRLGSHGPPGRVYVSPNLCPSRPNFGPIVPSSARSRPTLVPDSAAIRSGPTTTNSCQFGLLLAESGPASTNIDRTSTLGCAQGPIANAGLPLQIACVVLHLLGAILGFGATRLCGYDERTCRTVAIETAMKSSAFGFLLARQLGERRGVSVGNFQRRPTSLPLPPPDLDLRSNGR